MYFGFSNLGLVRHSRKKQTIEKNTEQFPRRTHLLNLCSSAYIFLITYYILRQKSVNTRLGELTQNIRNYQTEKKT